MIDFHLIELAPSRLRDEPDATSTSVFSASNADGVSPQLSDLLERSELMVYTETNLCDLGQISKMALTF